MFNNIYHRLNHEYNIVTDVTADKDMANDMDINVAANKDDDEPYIYEPISNVAQTF
jgi:hypothetical protein